MSINDSLFGSKKQASNVKLRHMFQEHDEDQEDNRLNDEIDREYQKNMSKITKNFNANHEKTSDEKTSLSALKHLLQLNSLSPTQSLYDYIEEVKQSNTVTLKEEIENNKEETEDNKEEEVSEIETDNELTEEHSLDIDQLIKSTEKEYLNSNDQKSVLQSLIQDINSNSKKQVVYDEEKLEKNINDILNESKDEEKDDEFVVNNEEDVHNIRKRSSQVNIRQLIIFILLVTISVIMYLNYDAIYDYLSNVNFKEYYQQLLEFFNKLF